jgi:hypothetical protein
MRVLPVFLFFVTIPIAAPQDKRPLANSDVNYLALRGDSLKEAFAVENIVLQRDVAKFTLRSGTIAFLAPVLDRVPGAVFVGEGRFELTPALALERNQMKAITNSETVDEEFTSAVLYFTDDTYDEVRKSTKTAVDATRAAELLKDSRKRVRKNFEETNLDAELLGELYNPATRGSFRAMIHGKKHSGLHYIVSPRGAFAELNSPEEVALLNIDPGSDQEGIWYLTHYAEEWKNKTASSAENHRAVAPEHYKIETTIAKNDHLAGAADCRFQSLRAGDRVIAFGLLPTLRVSKVSMGGQDLPFIQESQKLDGGFYVVLPSPTVKGTRYTLHMEYEGDKVITKAGGGNFSVGARTSWYPSLNEFSDFATYELTFKVPRPYVLVGVGKLVKESREGDFMVSEWKSDVPLAVAGFNYGRFFKKQATLADIKYDVEAYATEEPPDFLKSATAGAAFGENGDMAVGTMSPKTMANTVLIDGQNAIRVFERAFGPLPYGRIALTQQPQFNFGQSWPTLVYLPVSAFLDSTTRWQLLEQYAFQFAKFIQEVTPHEVSHQWWGHAVGWSTYHDQWLSEGFADFSTALFLEATNPKGDKALQFWKQARETLLEKNAYGRRANDAGPLWMGLRLDSPKNPGAYARVVYLKGAYVLQMLRSLMHDDKTGDKDFTEMLQDFVKTKMFQSATTEEFQAVAERHMKQRNFQENGKLDWFFAQWLYGTEIPRYALEYSIKTEADGQISFNGKLTQSEVSARFATMLPVYMDFDGRAVRVLTVPVVGSATREFSVKLPKKPKRVLLNVNYDVLCSDATVKETQ